MAQDLVLQVGVSVFELGDFFPKTSHDNRVSPFRLMGHPGQCDHRLGLLAHALEGSVVMKAKERAIALEVLRVI